MDDPVLWLGTVVLALAAAGCLLAPRAGQMRLAGAAVLVVAPTLVVADNWGTERIEALRSQPLVIAAGLVLALAAVVVAARFLAPRPWLAGLAAVAVLPFRIPIELGEGTANLLLPLYGVIAAGAVAAALRGPWRRGGDGAWTGSKEASDAEDDPAAGARAEGAGASRARAGWKDRSAPVELIPLLLAAFVVAYALQAVYADDISVAIERMAFFFAPFALLFRLLRTIRWDGGLLRLALAVITVEALAVAAVGFGQYAVGEIFWNEKVIGGNEAHVWFRVNSLFFDPNIMGRFLALVAVALAGVVAWTEERRRAGLATAAFLVLAAALTITFSVSSMLALFAGLCAVVAVRWGIGAGALTGAGVAAALAGVVVAIGGGGQISEETTGRSGLVSGGLELAADRPFWGYGSGTFSAEFTDRFEPEEGIAVESHTEPITVAVEQGIIGLIPFTLLVAVALISIAAAAGLSMGGARDPVLATLLAMLVVMVVHSLGYAALMIDPVTWALLAVGTTLGAARPMRQDRGGTASAAEPSRSGAYVATSGSG